MKKAITSALVLAAMSFAGQAVAQEATLPEKLDGFYRVTNTAFNETLTARQRYDLGTTIPDAANAGSIFTVTTDPMWSFAEAVAEIQALLDAGTITEAQHYEMFMALMTGSWKSGMYQIKSLKAQGVDYVTMIDKLPDYADAAIEYFLNNDLPTLYEDYYAQLLLLTAFAPDIITPSDLETVESFRRWAETYLTKWRAAADFAIFLQPEYAIPDDDSTPSYFTGKFYIEFKTPPYVGNMEKAQTWLNAVITNNGEDTEAQTLNIWESAKKYIEQEIARDYPEDSDAFKFAKTLLGDTNLNQVYAICEGEDGNITLLALPDAFNTQEIVISQEDIARATWQFDDVNEAQPFAVCPNAANTDGSGKYYTTLYTDFPCQMLSDGMKAYYAESIDAATGVAVLAEIQGDVIPGATAVVIESSSADMADNKLLPLSAEVEAVADNALLGTFFSMANDGYLRTIGMLEGQPAFVDFTKEIPANCAYMRGQTMGVSPVIFDRAGDNKIYDLCGREVKDASAKGIYIINGKKVIKF